MILAPKAASRACFASHRAPVSQARPLAQATPQSCALSSITVVVQAAVETTLCRAALASTPGTRVCTATAPRPAVCACLQRRAPARPLRPSTPPRAPTRQYHVVGGSRVRNAHQTTLVYGVSRVRHACQVPTAVPTLLAVAAATGIITLATAHMLSLIPPASSVLPLVVLSTEVFATALACTEAMLGRTSRAVARGSTSPAVLLPLTPAARTALVVPTASRRRRRKAADTARRRDFAWPASAMGCSGRRSAPMAAGTP